MKGRILALAALLGAGVLAAAARPAAAQVSCGGTRPATCETLFENITGDLAQIRIDPTRTGSFLGAAAFTVRDLEDVRFRDTGQLVFQSEFARLCLLEEIEGLRDFLDPNTGQVRPGNLAQFCQDVAALRARLTARRADGRINNCYFRLTCGFTSTGTLLRCNEDVRNCLTELLDEYLRCAAVTAGCTGVLP